MEIVEFLQLRSADLPSVVASVEHAIGVEANDALLAVGSIVEGLGNNESDMDLLLITPRPSSALPQRDEVPLVVGKCLIDVRILQLTDVEHLLARLRTWAAQPWDVAHALKFSIDERTLLHRLLHGHLLGGLAPDRIAAITPSRADLARLKLQVARQTARTIQVDMVGYRDSGDYRSLVFSAQDLLGHAVDALAAGHQLTHPVAKWRHRMLERVPDDWEQPLIARPTALSAVDQFWRLHRAPEQPDEKPALEHAFQISTYARAVFLWAENTLVKRSFVVPRIRTGALPTASHDAWLPRLDFDVDFFLDEGRAVVGRLNEFAGTVEVSADGLAVALLCDGATTHHEAAAMVYGSGDEAALRSVTALLSRVMGAELCYPMKLRSRA